MINDMAANTDINNVVNHLGQTVLHVAVEKQDNLLSKAVLFSGFNVNSKELCGITPQHIAVLSNNLSLCSMLLMADAEFSGPMFSGIPSPMEMAMKLHLQPIIEMF